MGVGVSIYFKELKNMVFIMLIFTMLSLPAYVLFWSGHTLNDPDRTADESFGFSKFIASFSLANIGEIAVNINQLDLYREARENEERKQAESKIIEMYCETGNIGEIVDYGIALPQVIDNEIDYYPDTYCELTIPDRNLNLHLDNCIEETYCEITIALPSTLDLYNCIQDYEGSRNKQDLNAIKD